MLFCQKFPQGFLLRTQFLFAARFFQKIKAVLVIHDAKKGFNGGTSSALSRYNFFCLVLGNCRLRVNTGKGSTMSIHKDNSDAGYSFAYVVLSLFSISCKCFYLFVFLFSSSSVFFLSFFGSFTLSF